MSEGMPPSTGARALGTSVFGGRRRVPSAGAGLWKESLMGRQNDPSGRFEE